MENLPEDRYAKISKEIYQKFPYLKNIPPKQKSLPNGAVMLSYSTSTETASGMVLPITIKVKVSAEGKIINISTSK